MIVALSIGNIVLCHGTIALHNTINHTDVAISPGAYALLYFFCVKFRSSSKLNRNAVGDYTTDSAL